MFFKSDPDDIYTILFLNTFHTIQAWLGNLNPLSNTFQHGVATWQDVSVTSVIKKVLFAELAVFDNKKQREPSRSPECFWHGPGLSILQTHFRTNIKKHVVVGVLESVLGVGIVISMS